MEILVVRMGEELWDLGFSVKGEEGVGFYRMVGEEILGTDGEMLDRDDESFDRELVDALEDAANKFLVQEVKNKFK